MEPKVLLINEPFRALDTLTRAQVQKSVKAIHGYLSSKYRRREVMEIDLGVPPS